MSDFDAIKALREQLVGVSEVLSSLKRQENRCEEMMSRAEGELNDVRKIMGFVRQEQQQLRTRIEQLEAEMM